MGQRKTYGVVGALVVAAVTLSLRGAAAESTSVHRIVIDGPISPASADYVETAIAAAIEGDSAALVIRLDTPGGLLNSTKTIVKAILASPVPVIVYVAPGGSSATSAGVFVTMAAHVAAMAPGTTIGAAHPVSGGGENIGGDMRQKVENYAVSFVESIAQRRGRNVEWAAQAVRESVSITENEALELRVVDFVAAELENLLSQAESMEVDVGGQRRKLAFASARDAGGGLRIVDIPMTFRQRVLNVLTDPNIAYLLMMGGVLGLYMEFSNPGAIFPGVAGVICLLLALLAAQVLPISSTGAILVLVGFAFLLAELFVPSFGVLGFGGIIAITLGSLFLYTPESNLMVDRSVIAMSVGALSLCFGLVFWLLWRDRRTPPRTGSEGLLGERGTAVSRVHGSGRVRVHGELWAATSEQPIEQGARVRVKGVEGLELKVEETTER